MIVAAALVPAGAGAGVRPEARYGNRADPLLAPRYKVFDVAWRQALTERGLLEYAPQEVAGPAVDDLTGEVVVATRDGRLRLLTNTGREIWSVEMGTGPTSAPAMTEEAIFVGGTDGSFHAFDRFDGTELWSTFLGAAVLERPVVAEGKIFVGTDHDAVHALDPATGGEAWVYRRDTVGTLTIRGGTGVGFGDGKIFAGFSDGAIVALGPADGRLIWQAPLGEESVDKFPDADAAPVFKDGNVFVTVFNEGTYALEANSGRVKWKADTRGATSLALSDDVLLVGGTSAWGLDPATGAVAWRIDLGKGYTNRPVPVRKLVVLAGSAGMIFAERETGKPLRVFDPGSNFSSAPAARGREVFALSNLGYLYALETVVGTP